MHSDVCALVVDDNRSTVRMLQLILHGEGYHVETAYEGYEALEKAPAAKPDIILLDVIMPGMNGHEVCEQLQSYPETKRPLVVFLTVKGSLDMPETAAAVMAQSIEDWGKGFDAGAVGFISKPFSASDILAEVTRALAIKRLGV
jgi:CheY-like chemotaxis protein